MTKRDQITQTFRDEIAAGTLKPGDQLPVRSEIEKRFGASLVTVQRAMHELIDEGWLTSHGCLGTRVAASPPHLNRYGLFFSYRPTESRPWVRFWTVLKRAAEEVLNQAPASVSIFYGLDVTASLEQFHAFHQTLRAQHLAGIIFASWPVPQMATILEREPRLPAAIFSSRPIPDLLTLDIPAKRIFEHACRLIAGRGCKRFAALMPSIFFTADSLDHAHRTLSEAGLHAPPGFIQQHASRHFPEAIHAQIDMLFAGDDPPDVLYLGDDNLIETAPAALRRLGKRVPDDVLLVCWGMLPWPELYTIPVLRLGVDMRTLVVAARDGIDSARRGEPLPAVSNATEVVVF